MSRLPTIKDFGLGLLAILIAAVALYYLGQLKFSAEHSLYENRDKEPYQTIDALEELSAFADSCVDVVNLVDMHTASRDSLQYYKGYMVAQKHYLIKIKEIAIKARRLNLGK